MNAKTGVKDGVYFVWNILVLILSLFVWRIAFALIGGILLIGLAIPFGVVFGASTAVGLSSATAIVISIVVGFVLTASIGSVAAQYGYECPRVDVSFTSPE